MKEAQDHLRQQAKKCRRLAIGTDKRTSDALLEAAEEYEARAASLMSGRKQPPPS